MTKFTTILLVAMPITAAAVAAAAATSLTVQVVVPAADQAADHREATTRPFGSATDLRVDRRAVHQVPIPLFRMEVPVLTVRSESRMKSLDRLPLRAELRLGIRAKGRMCIP